MCKIVEELAMEFAADAIAEGKAEATARATAKATAKAKRQTLKSAKTMLKDGLPADKVAKYTSLPIKEVRALMEQVG